MNIKKLALIGHPVSHSLSPLIHSYWLERYNLSGQYDTIDIQPENLSRDIKTMVDLGYEGFNVTLPHKQAIMNLCSTIDDTARMIGAVNTVVIENGILKGSNTDSFGFIENIKEQQRGFDFTSGPALVFGAGGAARAILHGLVQESVPEIILCNRTQETADSLAKEFGARSIAWEERHYAAKNVTLVVNTTSLGMKGKPALEFDIEKIPFNALVHDIVYAPLYTDLLTAANNRGMAYVTGIGMLLHQACAAFHEWFGIWPEITPELEDMIREKSR